MNEGMRQIAGSCRRAGAWGVGRRACRGVDGARGVAGTCVPFCMAGGSDSHGSFLEAFFLPLWRSWCSTDTVCLGWKGIYSLYLRYLQSVERGVAPSVALLELQAKFLTKSLHAIGSAGGRVPEINIVFIAQPRSQKLQW